MIMMPCCTAAPTAQRVFIKHSRPELRCVFCSLSVGADFFAFDLVNPSPMQSVSAVLPGDVITQPDASFRSQTAGAFIAGTLLLHKATHRYIPREGDMVVGVVTDKHAEQFNIDIRAPFLAKLPVLAFDGATKANRPNLSVGALVYCRVIFADREAEPEVSCVCEGESKSWVACAGPFGELKKGFVFEVSLGYAETLLSLECAVVNELGKHLAYELAVGHNGRVWVASASIKNCIVIVNAITNAEFLPLEQVGGMVRQLVSIIQN
jgi:exosome complex component RRP40